jgi:hypothetical protein
MATTNGEDLHTWREFEVAIHKCIERADKETHAILSKRSHQQSSHEGQDPIHSEEDSVLLLQHTHVNNILLSTATELLGILNKAAQEEYKASGVAIANEIRLCREESQRALTSNNSNGRSSSSNNSSSSSAYDAEFSSNFKLTHASLQPNKYRTMSSRLQTNYQILQAITHTKSVAYRTVMEFIHLQVQIVAKRAEEEDDGPTNKQQQQQQQQQPVQTKLRDCLQHDFLQTEKIQVNVQSIIDVWAVMFTGGNYALAENVLSGAVSVYKYKHPSSSLYCCLVHRMRRLISMKSVHPC